MAIGFLNLALLAGLAAVAIPPIIHFLNRRRQARAWCEDWLKQVRAGDRVAVLVAAQTPQAVVGELSADCSGVRALFERMPPPTGNADWPRAVADAWDLLRDRGQATRRDII